jgi:hypothetical protein
MSGKPVRWWKCSAAALMCLLPLPGVALAQLAASNAQTSAPAAEVSEDAATLQRYVGHYRLGDPNIQAVMTVTLSGTQLSTQLTGQPSVEIYPQTATHFFLKVVDANLDFVTNGKGPATALIVHQGGQNLTLPRMDDAAATQFNANLAARVQSKSPQPGSQAALTDWLGRMEKGQPPDYSKMSPQLAEVARSQADQTAGIFSSLGALRSLTFQGVEANGADTYLAKFLDGSLLIHIVVDSKGTIIGMFMQPAP